MCARIQLLIGLVVDSRERNALTGLRAAVSLRYWPRTRCRSGSEGHRACLRLLGEKVKRRLSHGSEMGGRRTLRWEVGEALRWARKAWRGKSVVKVIKVRHRYKGNLSLGREVSGGEIKKRVVQRVLKHSASGPLHFLLALSRTLTLFPRFI